MVVSKKGPQGLRGLSYEYRCGHKSVGQVMQSGQAGRDARAKAEALRQ